MLRIPSLLRLAGVLTVTLAVTACGGDRRLTEHTRAEPAPPLDLPAGLERPEGGSEYTLPETRRAEQLDADALRALQLPPEPRGEPAEDPNVRSDGPRLTGDDPPRLRIADDRDTVWSRLTAALAAGGFTVLERNRVERTMRIRDVEGGTEDGEGERRLVLEGSDPVVLRVTDADGNPLPEEETRRILGILGDRL